MLEGREMRISWLIGAALIATLAACSGEAENKSVPSPSVPVQSTTGDGAEATARVRVLVIGTSLTAGLGLDPEDAYPAVLQQMADSAGFNVVIAAEGLSGETSAGALRRTDWLMREPVAAVVIETGANDGLRGLDPDTTAANIVGIIEKVRAANPEARVLLAQMEAPPNLGARYTRDFRDLFLNIGREHGVTLIPFFLDGVAGNPEMNQSDGIHPNEAGARRAGENMWRALGPVLGQIPGVAGR